ncbi:MAG TPA: superoxide dismutase family protein [Burkholderiaceae bacterium]|nr:superoxide dismutase family protein [Burkholderiaceae bacterium]
MKLRFPLAALAAAVALAGCAGAGPYGAHGHPHGGPSAMAKLEPTRGNGTAGMAMFHQRGDQLMLHVRVEGLKPGQEHGFHIHEKGDCSSGDGMSTGGHFNPLGKPHGAHGVGEHHAGDLPSLKADASGRVDVHVTLSGLGIGSGATDIVGRGLIVHAQPDDYKTQPTGNAGARIACGVIAKA